MPDSQSPLEVGAEVDTNALIAEIREQVKEREERGEYPPEIASEIGMGSHPGSEDDVVNRALQQLRRATTFSAVVSTESGKPYVAPAISGVKRAIQRTIQWYMGAVLDQLRGFADMSVAAIELLARRNSELEARVLELEQRIHSLENR